MLENSTHFSGFEFFLLPSRVHARPSVSIPLGKITLGDDAANRWALARKVEINECNRKIFEGS